MTAVPSDLVQPGETFKVHPEFPHLHVSDYGRVWSSKSNKFVGRRGGGGPNRTGNTSNRGQNYWTVNVPSATTACGSTSRGTHVLVLETFVGPRPDRHDADHIDHNSSNNLLSNLRWRDLVENRNDTVR